MSGDICTFPWIMFQACLDLDFYISCVGYQVIHIVCAYYNMSQYVETGSMVEIYSCLNCQIYSAIPTFCMDGPYENLIKILLILY